MLLSVLLALPGNLPPGEFIPEGAIGVDLVSDPSFTSPPRVSRYFICTEHVRIESVVPGAMVELAVKRQGTITTDFVTAGSITDWVSLHIGPVLDTDDVEVRARQDADHSGLFSDWSAWIPPEAHPPLSVPVVDYQPHYKCGGALVMRNYIPGSLLTWREIEVDQSHNEVPGGVTTLLRQYQDSGSDSGVWVRLTNVMSENRRIEGYYEFCGITSHVSTSPNGVAPADLPNHDTRVFSPTRKPHR